VYKRRPILNDGIKKWHKEIEIKSGQKKPKKRAKKVLTVRIGMWYSNKASLRMWYCNLAAKKTDISLRLCVWTLKIKQRGSEEKEHL